jgi:hypothetical protein
MVQFITYDESRKEPLAMRPALGILFAFTPLAVSMYDE